MTDHPLTPDPVKQYIDDQKIEVVMNTGINKVLRERPSDALSALAVYLTSNAEKRPIFSRFECEQTIIGGKYPSFNTQVFIDFAGETKCRHIHSYTFENYEYSESEEEKHNQHISQAMEIITNDLNSLLTGKDLSLLKKTDMALQKFYEEKFALAQEAEGEGSPETQENPVAGELAIKVASEALIHGIAKCYDDYNTFDSYGTVLTGTKVDPESFTKLMITVLETPKVRNLPPFINIFRQHQLEEKHLQER